MSYLFKKTQFKALTLGLFLFGVILSGVIAADITSCDSTSLKPLLNYNETTKANECIALADCKATYATENKCSKSESDCPRKQAGKPGYKRLAKEQSKAYQQCVLCPTNQPVASADFTTCGLCDNNQVFSYKSGECSSLDAVQMAPVKEDGYFSIDMKIYYTNSIQATCPAGQIIVSFPEKQSRICQWCPITTILVDTSTSCKACDSGKITDESTRTCLAAKTDCKNKLSSDGKFCLLKCPPGEMIDATVQGGNQCKKCADATPFSSFDSSKCVAKCSDNNELEYQKVKNGCVKKESCDGFILDSNNICLKSSCEVLTATQTSPAIKLLPKDSKLSYQTCTSCPAATPFLFSSKPDQAADCSNCTSVSLIQDYVAGKCSKMADLKDGFLDKTENTYYPSSQKCPIGYYQMQKQISKTDKTIKKCMPCPSTLPISSDDGLSCTRTCPDNKIADEKTHSCVDAAKYTCSGDFFLSSDKKSCSAGCPSGEIKDASNKGQCVKCPPLKNLRNQDETQCLSKCPDNSIYHKKLQKCIDKQSSCQDGLFLQSDGKTCDELCPANQIMSKDATLSYNVCVDCTNKYKLVKDEYTYCGDSCPDGFYGDSKFACHPFAECSGFITGSVPVCSDACQIDEYIYDKRAQDSFTFCNKNCNDIKFTNSAGIKTCTQSCYDYVDSTKTCVKQCSSDEYLNPKNPEQTYIQCTKTCKNFYQFDDGQQKCVDSCTDVQSSDTTKKICAKSCKAGELAVDKASHPPLQDYICTVADKCAKDYIAFTSNNIKKCAKVCPLYLSVDKTTCLEKCEKDQFALEVLSGALIKYECSKTQTCDKYKFKYTDENGANKCSDTCRSYLSSDEKTCSKSCAAGEYIIEKKDGQAYFACSKACTSSQFEFVDEKTTLKYCLSDCPLYLSEKKCLKSCPVGQVALDKQPGKKYSECAKSCEGFPFTDKDGVSRCSKICPNYLQSDGKACGQSCAKGEYILDKTRDAPYFKCSSTCDGFEYHIDENTKRCSKRCPEGFIENVNSQKQKSCIKRSECKNYISSDGNQCIEKCNQNNKEFIRSVKDQKECAVCKKYYVIDKDVASCNDECPSDQVGVPSEMKCFSPKDGTKECDTLKLKLSSDKKKCTEQCQYPEVSDSKGQCKKPCSSKDQSCKKCEDKELSFTVGSVESCIKIEECVDKISSDNKRCIASCSIVSEQEQANSKFCVKCKAEQVPILQDNKIICQQKDNPNILDSKLQSAKNFIKQSIDSKDKVEEVKKQIEDLSKDIFEKVKQKNTPAKNLIKDLVSIAQNLVNSITLSDVGSSQHTIGSKDDIITNVQKKKEGYKFKKEFSLENIQNGTGNLLEENKDQSSEDINILSASAIAQNPSCTTDSCKQYPLFQVDFQATTNKRMLDDQQKSFTVTFNVDKPDQIKKYICLQYNLDDSTQKPTKMQTTPSGDSKSVSCVVQQNVSILFDQQCEYVDKTNCPTDQIIQPEEESEDSDDGLSAGAIAGIVIGSIAFVGISVFLGVCLYKRHQANNKSNKYQETNKSPSGGSPADRSPADRSPANRSFDQVKQSEA